MMLRQKEVIERVEREKEQQRRVKALEQKSNLHNQMAEREELKRHTGIHEVDDIARHLKSVRNAIETVQRERGRIADLRRKDAEAGRSSDIDFDTIRSQIRGQLDRIRDS